MHDLSQPVLQLAEILQDERKTRRLPKTTMTTVNDSSSSTREKHGQQTAKTDITERQRTL